MGQWPKRGSVCFPGRRQPSFRRLANRDGHRSGCEIEQRFLRRYGGDQFSAPSGGRTQLMVRFRPWNILSALVIALLMAMTGRAWGEAVLLPIPGELPGGTNAARAYDFGSVN